MPQTCINCICDVIVLRRRKFLFWELGRVMFSLYAQKPNVIYILVLQSDTTEMERDSYWCFIV